MGNAQISFNPLLNVNFQKKKSFLRRSFRYFNFWTNSIEFWHHIVERRCFLVFCVEHSGEQKEILLTYLGYFSLELDRQPNCRVSKIFKNYFLVDHRIRHVIEVALGSRAGLAWFRMICRHFKHLFGSAVLNFSEIGLKTVF